MLHLASCNVLADPEAWAIFQTIRDVRELGGFDKMECILGLFANVSDGLPCNGPTSVLIARLQRLGWTLGSHGLIQDRLGCFFVLFNAFQHHLPLENSTSKDHQSLDSFY